MTKKDSVTGNHIASVYQKGCLTCTQASSPLPLPDDPSVQPSLTHSGTALLGTSDEKYLSYHAYLIFVNFSTSPHYLDL